MEHYDKIIIGAGIFGLYAALKSIAKGEKVLVLEYDDAPFKRASFINQARIHNGYHYPRSFTTAKMASCYFDRFVDDFGFAILKDFKQIYATSKHFSYTNSEQFAKFCDAVNVPLEPICSEIYFKRDMCDGAFVTTEYAFDAEKIKEYFWGKLSKASNFTIQFNSRVQTIKQLNATWQIATNCGISETPYLINASYASLNQVLLLAGLEPFAMKYELCEVILCKVSENIKNIGLTVMDGPFFSLMPFGHSGLHSLTAVGNTPHMASRDLLPTFSCQNVNGSCSRMQLKNCNDCPNRPRTAFMDMYKLAKKYFNDDIKIEYQKSLFSMKAILLASEVDDSRPTIIRFTREHPKFLSVFSGKINMLYELDEVL